ncbi:MAG: group III truncated hemoglobin [Opitutaceae bacterium]|nr:group III truncated hemoglobin [Cytophagales bacterium]
MIKEVKNENADIFSEKNVGILVNAFYEKVRQDKLLADVFNPIIKDNWDFNLKRTVNFWSTILLYTKQYKDDPMPKHLPLAIKKPIPL